MSVNYTVDTNALCLRYVIPFKYTEYTKSFEETCKKADRATIGGKNIWERNIGNNAESDLYSYVKDEFLFDSDASVEGSLSDMKMGYEWKRAIGKHNIAEFTYLDRGLKKDEQDFLTESMTIYISEAGLMLFRNEIGFIWYEIKLYPKKNQILDSEYLKNFQYDIREINRNEVHLLEKSSEKMIGGFVAGGVAGHEQYLSPSTLSYWVNRQLEFLDDVHYFAERKLSYEKAARNAGKTIAAIRNEEMNTDEKLNIKFQNAPDKPILFTYAMLSYEKNNDDENNEESQYTREELSYHLTNGYRASYHFSNKIEQDMRFPFEDVIWYSTNEGVSYLSWASEDNRKFFGGNFVNKVKTDYFTLVIKTLYQSYSLLTYAEMIQSEISAVYDKNKVDPRITELYKEVNLFLTKSMATSVSFIHHQSDFYVYLKKQFRILEDVESVNSGLSALEVIQREQERLEDETREKESDNKVQAIMGLFALLGIGSAFVDTYDFITKFFVNDETAVKSLSDGALIAEGIAGTVILIVSGLAVFFAFKAIINAFGSNKKK